MRIKVFSGEIFTSKSDVGMSRELRPWSLCVSPKARPDSGSEMCWNVEQPIQEAGAWEPRNQLFVAMLANWNKPKY